ncbi:cathepsin L, putative [Perkinsus marinus ATCC 50983]|uniref:Cathepsin L, putative n=1 Tax=Perkinsus marinus (strain ATCC 50983 / TXsc) TaxID=423536 RepID=C5KZ17_PERM5|nr:cathepsin L, putative [Perkinsus marinus ATCC 50983]EER10281.1 cathepsin L, putative [Perkinsus marinus ATCC 50983]|eukprot:XP_002778486.1 cathepsin L, putative [Perkinsus marinus ATCC 50983]
MTDEEFKKMMVCNDHISRKVARIIDPDSEEGTRLKKKLRVLAPPKSVDWRAAGAVTPVRKQAGCGCCYAMATTEATEGIFQIKTNKLIQLSVQQIVDCSAFFGNEGCTGGFQYNSYHYIDEEGIVSESAYPYVAAAGTCKTTITRDPKDLIGWWPIKEGDLEELLEGVAQQPVSAILNAFPADFKQYKGGIYKSDACDKSKSSHSVLITGYGEDKDGTKYWEFKNSWGTDWGMQGYGRLLRGKGGEGECGILKQAYYPLLKDDLDPGELCV